jgi:hypothetical protein
VDVLAVLDCRLARKTSREEIVEVRCVDTAGTVGTGSPAQPTNRTGS